MGGRDNLEDFWGKVKIECHQRGIEVGSPKRGTELSVTEFTGVAWTIHHRKDHIRPGIIIRTTTKSNPKMLLPKLRGAIKDAERIVGRKMVVEYKPENKSRKARIYFNVDSFDAENISTWPSAISQTVDEWCVIMNCFRPYLS